MAHTAPVMHGRRKGGNRLTPEPPSQLKMKEKNQLTNGTMLPDGTDLRQVTVLTKNDWDRIQFQLNKRQIEREKIRKAREEKERLHELSKEKVKNWSNTITGQRQRKLEARHLREEKEEEERKLVDIEEAKYQATKRKEAIERAKTQQYYQTDRVKGFHGALVLTEVLKEREAQIELKRLKEKASAGKDREWLDLSRREYEEGILKDHDGARERIKKAADTASFQKAQIRDHLRATETKAREDDMEGEELKQLAAQYEMEKGRLDEIRADESRQLMSDNLRQIDDVKRMREIHKLQEEEEDDECRIFAAAKRKMMKMRQEKERQLHKDKQEGLEQIRQKLHGQMQQKIDDEDDRIARATEDNEAKRAKEEAITEDKIRKAHNEIAAHRHEMMAENERKAADERRKELEMLAVRREADAVFARNEDEKRGRKFGEMKDLQNFHGQQIDEKEDKRVQARELNLDQDHKNQGLVQLEEAQFQEYARRVVDHCERGGRNTIPLRKAAREGAGGGLGPVFPGKGGIRPSYMVSDQSGVQLPAYQRDTTEGIKKDIYGDGRTDKRLGFVW